VKTKNSPRIIPISPNAMVPTIRQLGQRIVSLQGVVDAMRRKTQPRSCHELAFVLKNENDFLLAQGGSVTRPHDPADDASAGSEEEVIFRSVATPRWGSTKYENQVQRTEQRASHLRLFSR
jgi:hypothetical protein